MKTKKVDIIIPNGKDNFNVQAKFEQGYKIIACMFLQVAGDTDKNVNIEFKKSNGNTIVDPMLIDFLKKSNDGFKMNTAFPLPPDIDSNLGLQLVGNSDPMTSDYKGQLLFILEENAFMDANNEVKPLSDLNKTTSCEY